MVRIAVLTIDWSSAGRNMARSSPDRMVRICAWVYSSDASVVGDGRPRSADMGQSVPERLGLHDPSQPPVGAPRRRPDVVHASCGRGTAAYRDRSLGLLP